jgi:hypothetical protein
MSNELANFFENNPSLVEHGLDEDTLCVLYTSDAADEATIV